MKIRELLLLILLFISACQSAKENKMDEEENVEKSQSGTFGYDLEFISKFTDPVVLKDKTGKPILFTSPEHQGRVFTSSFDGLKGKSLGYINYQRAASNEILPHTQGYGGEDRFWIGPQGGQYTIYFNPGDPFDFDHWFTPAPFDTESFDLVAANDSSVHYHKEMNLRNYVNTSFDLAVDRKIGVIEHNEALELLRITGAKDLKYVGFESSNKITNTGNEPWKKETGLLSIWILGMFPGGSTIVIPYKESVDSEFDSPYNEYFTEIIGKLDENHLKKGENVLFYNGSGNYIGKIGVKPKYTKPVVGSYDEIHNILTILQYSFVEGETDYVNSQWEIQVNPYKGDVVNAYNDGPLNRASGAKLTFYELESSSPARELEPGESMEHVHRTFHFQGDKGQLNKITKALFGLGIDEIERQF